MKIMIDPGHGGSDPGAVSRGYVEKNIALAIARKLAKELLDAGQDVRCTRTEDVFVGLTARCQMANQWNAGLFVSIHLNADADDDGPGTKEARGAEVWIYPAAMKSKFVADHIAAEIRQAFPDEPFRGVKADDLAVCRMTQMPAVLVEVGFIDNSKSVLQLASEEVQARMAGAICRGVLAALEDM